MIYYSKSTKGFYITEIHGMNIPSDCVKISFDTHQRILKDQSRGKQITEDENGYPLTVDAPTFFSTWEEIRVKRDVLLKDSDWAAFPDANPKPSKEAWLTYRQTLRDIPNKFSKPEEVVWPQKPQ